MVVRTLSSVSHAMVMAVSPTTSSSMSARHRMYGCRRRRQCRRRCRHRRSVVDTSVTPVVVSSTLSSNSVASPSSSTATSVPSVSSRVVVGGVDNSGVDIVVANTDDVFDVDVICVDVVHVDGRDDVDIDYTANAVIQYRHTHRYIVVVIYLDVGPVVSYVTVYHTRVDAE